MKNLITKEEKDQIDLICKKHRIKNYSINPDGSIDVDGDASIRNLDLKNLPIKFGNVSGSFYCSLNSLTTLEGSPHTVGGVFNCNDNKLTNLIGGPVTVGSIFACSSNKLTDLVGAPTTVGGKFNVGNNKITSTYSGDTDINVSGVYLINPQTQLLPKVFMDNNEHLSTIIKYQRYFMIWNDDLSFNEENFQILLDEIKDGLE